MQGITMIDWQQVILNLWGKGFSYEMIASRCGSNQQHIARIGRGECDQPKFNTGIQILDLHFDNCIDRHNEIIKI